MSEAVLGLTKGTCSIDLLTVAELRALPIPETTRQDTLGALTNPAALGDLCDWVRTSTSRWRLVRAGVDLQFASATHRWGLNTRLRPQGQGVCFAFFDGYPR